MTSMKLFSRSAVASCALLLRSTTTTHAFVGVAPTTATATATATATTTAAKFASRFYSSSSSALKMATSSSSSKKPFGVIVEAEIQPDRMEEFLNIMENNAQKSRQEPGCLRFDVLRIQDNPNKFVFYELYESNAAVDFHKTQDHYQAWATFKESGGTVTSVTKKADGEFCG